MRLYAKCSRYMVDTPLSASRLPNLNVFLCLHFIVTVNFLSRTPWEGDWTFAKSLPTKQRTQKKTCRPITHALRGFRTNNTIIPTRRYRLGLALTNDYHDNNAPRYWRCPLLLITNTPSPCCTPLCFNFPCQFTPRPILVTPLCFNFPCQFTPFLNLRSHTSALTPFRWRGSTVLCAPRYPNSNHDYILLTPHFFRTQLRSEGMLCAPPPSP